jgi:hypothetical protein
MKPLKPFKQKNTGTGKSILPNIRRRSVLEHRILSKKRSGHKPSAFLRKNLKFIRMIPVFILAGLLGYGMHFLFIESPQFKITQVDITGIRKFVSYADLQSVVNANALNKSILFFNTKGLSDKLTRTFLGAKQIAVEKKYPNTLKVDVRERIPLAILYKKGTTDLFLIDGEGYVLGPVQDEFSHLPKIEYSGDILIGHFVEKDIVPISSEIIRQADYQNLKISSISFHPKYTSIYVNDKILAYLGNEKSIEQEIKVIGAMIKSYEAQKALLNQVDLRFDKVYVN